jgi:hypothetical protein
MATPTKKTRTKNVKTKKSCKKLVEENSFQMCEAEFPNDMKSVEKREKALLEVILANACTSPCKLRVTVKATIVPKTKLCRRLSGHFGRWVQVEYTAACV